VAAEPLIPWGALHQERKNIYKFYIPHFYGRILYAETYGKLAVGQLRGRILSTDVLLYDSRSSRVAFLSESCVEP